MPQSIDNKRLPKSKEGRLLPKFKVKTYTYVISFWNESNPGFLQSEKLKRRSSYLLHDLNHGPPAPKTDGMTNRPRPPP